jgi:predicted nucleic-acid-binding protein
VKVAPDTNILVRAVTEDDAEQGSVAQNVLRKAEIVAIAVSALCELVWVLSRGYKIPKTDIAHIVRGLMDAGNVVTDGPTIEAGLAMLDAGGDFADGVIAHEGSWLGADSFVSFDKKAVELLRSRGQAARLLG